MPIEKNEKPDQLTSAVEQISQGPNIKTLKAQRQHWQGPAFKFDPREHLDSFNESEAEVSMLVKEEKIEPVKLTIAQVSRNSTVVISFNQPLIVPKFI